SLRGIALAADGSDSVRASVVGPVGDAGALGIALARELLDLGARDLLA
ncbi:hydroxymethylbilane synthase, partial [Mycobacterium kansasii]